MNTKTFNPDKMECLIRLIDVQAVLSVRAEALRNLSAITYTNRDIVLLGSPVTISITFDFRENKDEQI
jgi:hypothetical protein